MKIKRFNELNEAEQPIQNKSINQQVDEILDSLSKKKKLSKSEQEFMEEASKGTISQVTTPKLTGNFWADMSNPHNIGILWIGKNGIWKQLKTVEDEEDEKLEETENDDERYERKKKQNILKYGEELPGLTETINDWALIVKSFNEQQGIYYNKLMNLAKDKDSNYKYQYQQKVEYATNGKLESLFNQFGPFIDSIEWDDNEGMYIKKK